MNSSSERFEELAAKFYHETGVIAPGKDQPAAFGGSPSYEEREEAWRVWIAARAVPVNENPIACEFCGEPMKPLTGPGYEVVECQNRRCAHFTEPWTAAEVRRRQAAKAAP